MHGALLPSPGGERQERAPPVFRCWVLLLGCSPVFPLAPRVLLSCCECILRLTFVSVCSTFFCSKPVCVWVGLLGFW